MAWCHLADSHYPNRSPEQCLQTQSYVIIRIKLVNLTTLLLAQTVNGTGCPGTQCSTGHCMSVSGRPAAQRPTGHCVARHLGTQRPAGHCVAHHPGTQWWTGHCVAGHPGTQRSTAHCVAGTRVHSIVHFFSRGQPPQENSVGSGVVWVTDCSPYGDEQVDFYHSNHNWRWSTG